MSPAKTQPRKPSDSQRRDSQITSTESDLQEEPFETRFVSKGEYGRALRRIEIQAYRCTKAGKAVTERTYTVEHEDEDEAIARGVDRAEMEMGLQSVADAREQRLREGYEERIVRLSGEKRNAGGGGGGRRGSFYEQRK